MLLVSVDPVVDGTVKSCVVEGAVAATDDVVSEDVVSPEVVPLEVVPLLVGSVVTVAVGDGVLPSEVEVKLMLLDEPRLLEVMAALLPVPAAPSDANSPEPAVADELEPEVTLNVSVPSLDSSQGAPDAAGPPFRLMPIT